MRPRVDGLGKLAISEERVRQIAAEEIARARSRRMSEGTDHQASAKVVTAASKLLAAVEAFEKATAEMSSVGSATMPHVGKLKEILGKMVETPGAYVSHPKTQQVVKLRPQKSGGDGGVL